MFFFVFCFFQIFFQIFVIIIWIVIWTSLPIWLASLKTHTQWSWCCGPTPVDWHWLGPIRSEVRTEVEKMILALVIRDGLKGVSVLPVDFKKSTYSALAPLDMRTGAWSDSLISCITDNNQFSDQLNQFGHPFCWVIFFTDICCVPPGQRWRGLYPMLLGCNRVLVIQLPKDPGRFHVRFSALDGP